jgi:ABC-type branched-subunit amino acid transport system substrate-binding protein
LSRLSRRRAGGWARIAALLALGGSWVSAAAPNPPASPHPAGLDLRERQGKQIYLQGTSPTGGKISASLSGNELPANALPCAGCHGRDGRGKPEGGVDPSNLQWDELTKPYEVTTPSGRRHGAYPDRLFVRAVSLGLDPAGNPLNPAMPRYQMSREDMDRLLAYLQRLGREPVPGVSDAEIRVGALVAAGTEGEAVRGALEAWSEDLNQAGGIYGRKIRLVPAALSSSPEKRREETARFLDQEPPVFAVLGLPSDSENRLPELFEERETPLLGATDPRIRREDFPSRYVFYLDSGYEDQGKALVQFAAAAGGVGDGGGKAPKIAILAEDAEPFTGCVTSVSQEAVRLGWPVFSGHYAAGAFSADVAKDLQKAGVELVVFAGRGADQKALLAAADQLGWKPRLLSWAAFAGADLLAAEASWDGRIYLALPTLPPDPQFAQGSSFLRFAERHRLARVDVGGQMRALAAARVLVEALQRAGRDVDRESLIERLQELRQFDTGFSPPITYGPGRRIGALGSYVVQLNLKDRTFAPVGGWIEVQ